jgi:hypothetical protein
MYRVDSLYPDRLVCDACATAIGAVAFEAFRERQVVHPGVKIVAPASSQG